MSGRAVRLLFSLSCREMLSVGPECGPCKVLCGQGGALGGPACPCPALTASCFLLSGRREGEKGDLVQGLPLEPRTLYRIKVGCPVMDTCS